MSGLTREQVRYRRLGVDPTLLYGGVSLANLKAHLNRDLVGWIANGKMESRMEPDRRIVDIVTVSGFRTLRCCQWAT